MVVLVALAIIFYTIIGIMLVLGMAIFFGRMWSRVDTICSYRYTVPAALALLVVALACATLAMMCRGNPIAVHLGVGAVLSIVVGIAVVATSYIYPKCLPHLPRRLWE